MQTDQATPGASRAQDTDTSADTSTNATPNGGNTPTGTVVVPARDRSGTIIARPVWDQPTNAGGANARRPHRSRLNVPAASAGPSTSTSAANSRPETETEDDGDVDMDRESRDGDAPSPSPERQPTDTGTIRATHSRRAVGIVTDAAGPAGPGASMDMNSDPHIVINDEGVVTGVGVEDGIVSLEANDDFAMGAPPGAPGAIDGPPARAVADTHAGAYLQRHSHWHRRRPGAGASTDRAAGGCDVHSRHEIYFVCAHERGLCEGVCACGCAGWGCVWARGSGTRVGCVSGAAGEDGGGGPVRCRRPRRDLRTQSVQGVYRTVQGVSIGLGRGTSIGRTWGTWAGGPRGALHTKSAKRTRDVQFVSHFVLEY